jgi:hypothetical protein
MGRSRRDRVVGRRVELLHHGVALEDVDDRTRAALDVEHGARVEELARGAVLDDQERSSERVVSKCVAPGVPAWSSARFAARCSATEGVGTYPDRRCAYQMLPGSSTVSFSSCALCAQRREVDAAIGAVREIGAGQAAQRIVVQNGRDAPFDEILVFLVFVRRAENGSYFSTGLPLLSKTVRPVPTQPGICGREHELAVVVNEIAVAVALGRVARLGWTFITSRPEPSE